MDWNLLLSRLINESGLDSMLGAMGVKEDAVMFVTEWFKLTLFAMFCTAGFTFYESEVLGHLDAGAWWGGTHGCRGVGGHVDGGHGWMQIGEGCWW